MKSEQKHRIEKQMIEITLANDIVLDINTLEEIRLKGMKPISHLIGDWKVKSISSIDKMSFMDKITALEKENKRLRKELNDTT
tara:strand:- start:58 stop:306 length:249 start_codon:yes stop_codon:yes gene_type:complete